MSRNIQHRAISENDLPLDKLQEENADSHLLVFEIPATKADEEFINAELRILTIVQRKTKPGEQNFSIRSFEAKYMFFRC